MESSRKNWAKQYEEKQDQLREDFLKKKLYKLIEESKQVNGTKNKIKKLEAAKEIFLTLSREAYDYNEQDEEDVAYALIKLYKKQEEEQQENTVPDSWEEYKKEEEILDKKEQEQNDDDNLEL